MGEGTTEGNGYDAELRDVAKGGGLGMVGKFGQQLIAVVVGPVTARLLGSAGYGLLALGFSFVDMVDMFLSLGYPSAIVRFGGIYSGEKDRDKLRGLVAGTLMVVVPLGMIVACILFLHPDLLSRYYPKVEGLDGVLRIVVVAMPIKLATAILGPTTIAMRTMRYRVISDLLIRPVNLIIILLLCGLLGWDARGAALAIVLGSVVSLTIYGIGVRRLVGTPRPSDLRHYEGRKITAFALPMLLAQASLFGLFRINGIIGGAYLTASQLGHYQAASRVATFGTFGLNSVAAIIRPVMASMHDDGRMDELRGMYRTGARWVWYLTLPIALVTIFKAPSAMAAFGKSFVEGSDAVTALRLLMAGRISQAAIGNAGSLIAMSGYQWLSAGNNILMAVVNIVLCVILTKRRGIIGLAMASLIATTGVSTLRAFEIWHLHRATAFGRKTLKPLLAALVTWPLLLISFEYWPLDLFVPAILFMLAYVGLVWKLGLEPDDRVITGSISRKLGGIRNKHRKDPRPPTDESVGAPDREDL